MGKIDHSCPLAVRCQGVEFPQQASQLRPIDRPPAQTHSRDRTGFVVAVLFGGNSKRSIGKADKRHHKKWGEDTVCAHTHMRSKGEWGNNGTKTIKTQPPRSFASLLLSCLRTAAVCPLIFLLAFVFVVTRLVSVCPSSLDLKMCVVPLHICSRSCCFLTR